MGRCARLSSWAGGIVLLLGARGWAQIELVDGSREAGIPPQCLTFYPGDWVGGCAAADFNNDGMVDLYVAAGHDFPDRLFINNGDGTFTDMATGSGLDVAHNGWAAAAGDYDKDGWTDIFVISSGTPPAVMEVGKNRLYKNNGNGTFTNKATSAGVLLVSSTFPGGRAAAFGDYDLDGDLDLAVGFGAPVGSGGDKLFRNNGNGTFTNVTSAALGSPFATTQTWSIRFADMNGDFYPELLWVADYGTSRYFVNNGNGTFTDMTVAAGAGTDEYGMGQCVNDVDNDGDPDWYISSILGFPFNDPTSVGNKLYLNDGKGAFAEVAVPAGVDEGGWGWGTAAEDFDLDGDVDLVETSGHEFGPESWDDLLRLWNNNGDGTYTEIPVMTDLDKEDGGRGLLTFDYDLDGDLDVVVMCNDRNLYLFRNDTPRGNRAWLNVTLDTTGMHIYKLAAGGQGSRITATVGGQTWTRWMLGASNFYAQSEMIANFGLNTASKVDTLKVFWVNGRVTTLHDVDVNQRISVRYRPADLNGDGIVNGFDLALLLGAWTGAATYAPCAPALPADLNLDCKINGLDLATLLGDWG
jgi:hypothetical protein